MRWRCGVTYVAPITSSQTHRTRMLCEPMSSSNAGSVSAVSEDTGHSGGGARVAPSSLSSESEMPSGLSIMAATSRCSSIHAPL
eukprot:5666965-Prymnesium_polylepis.1